MSDNAATILGVCFILGCGLLRKSGPNPYHLNFLAMEIKDYLAHLRRKG